MVSGSFLDGIVMGAAEQEAVGDFLYICCICKQGAQACPPEEGRKNQQTANDSHGLLGSAVHLVLQ